MIQLPLTYKLALLISSISLASFLVLLILSICGIGLYWAVGLIGLLGSIGLWGTVMLSCNRFLDRP